MKIKKTIKSTGLRLISAFLFTTFIICSFIGCSSPADTPTEPKVTDIPAIKDTFLNNDSLFDIGLTVNTNAEKYQFIFSCCSLTYTQPNGMGNALCCDSSHPMSIKKENHTKLSISKNTEADFIFTNTPHEVSVYRWNLSELCREYGDPETASLKNGRLTLVPNSVYMIVANWHGNELNGSASYYFITEK